MCNECEHDELFHQDIKEMEKRYQDETTCNILPDYCRTISHDNPSRTFKKAKKCKINLKNDFSMYLFMYFFLQNKCLRNILLSNSDFAYAN